MRKPQFGDAFLDHGRTPHQDGTGEAFVHHDLRRMQYAFVFALGIHQPFRVLFGDVEHRFHQHVGVVDELRQLLAVGIHVGDGAFRHAAVHGRPGHGGGDARDQARVERFGDEVFGTEREVLFAVHGRHFIRLFGFGQFGDGVHGGLLHGLVDGGGAHVQRAPEDIREAQGVVDLVGVVGTAGGHDGVGAHGLHFFRHDLGGGVGQGEDERFGRHLFDHLGLEHTAGGQAQEGVRAGDDFAQGAGGGGHRIARLVVVHFFRAACVHHAFDVGDDDVFHAHAETDQHVQAGQRRGTGAAGHQFDVFDLLADDLEAVQQGGTHDDGGAVLVVMEHRDVHAFAQLGFDVEAFRGFDVFEVDAAEGGFQGGDDVDQFVRIAFGDFQVEDVDAGEFLEQDAFAFHDGFRRQGPDVAQSQHGGAVGDDGDQVGACGHVAHFGGVVDDEFACSGHAG